jgi:Coenzyme F420-reducing hydrogenase, alpha subunit
LIPEGTAYSYFGNTVQCSEGWQEPIENYKQYLDERVVNYSHAKRSLVKGKPVLVGALARLHFSHERLSAEASALYKQSPLAQGESNTFLNNLAQAIELVDAIDQAKNTIDKLLADSGQESLPDISSFIKAGAAVGAVECPRGTLYHYYQVDSQGKILAADMITPSAQNSARIEQDICTVANEYLKTKTDVNHSDNTDGLQAALETLVRAFDPCNTCATHMVSVRSLTT